MRKSSALALLAVLFLASTVSALGKLDLHREFDQKWLNPRRLQSGDSTEDDSKNWSEDWQKWNQSPDHVFVEDGIEYVDTTKRNETMRLVVSQDVSAPNSDHP